VRRANQTSAYGSTVLERLLSTDSGGDPSFCGPGVGINIEIEGVSYCEPCLTNTDHS